MDHGESTNLTYNNIVDILDVRVEGTCISSWRETLDLLESLIGCKLTNDSDPKQEEPESSTVDTMDIAIEAAGRRVSHFLVE